MRKSVVINGIVLAAIAATVGGTVALIGNDSSSGTTSANLVTAKRANVLSTVSTTGNVEAQSDLALSFQQSGTVTAILVKAGDRVAVGQVLARVDATQQTTALASAEASLASAQASLAGTLRGETSAERAQDAAGLATAREQVTSAQLSLDHARQTAAANVPKYQQQIDQAATSLTQAETALTTAQDNETRAHTSLRALQNTYDTAATAIESASAAVARYQLDQVGCQAHASDATWEPADGAKCAQITSLLSFANSWQTSVSSVTQARNSVVTAQQGVTQAAQSRQSGLLQDTQSIQNAQSQLDSANTSYASTVAQTNAKQQPAKPEAVAQSRSSVIAAQQQVQTAQKNLDDTELRATVAGTVAAVSGSVGDQSSAAGGASATGSSSSTTSSSSSSASGFITLTNVDSLVIKAGFTETDIPKLKLGQATTISLDAVPNSSYVGTVESIDATQTVVNNVVTYYAIVRFKDRHVDDVKPGMTASVSVVLDKRDNVVTLPTSALPTAGTTATVTVRAQGRESSRAVGIGLRGDNAVEITSGLAAGDHVVVRTTSRTGGSGGFAPPGGGGGLGGGLGGGR